MSQVAGAAAAFGPSQPVPSPACHASYSANLPATAADYSVDMEWSSLTPAMIPSAATKQWQVQSAFVSGAAESGRIAVQGIQYPEADESLPSYSKVSHQGWGMAPTSGNASRCSSGMPSETPSAPDHQIPPSSLYCSTGMQAGASDTPPFSPLPPPPPPPPLPLLSSSVPSSSQGTYLPPTLPLGFNASGVQGLAGAAAAGKGLQPEQHLSTSTAAAGYHGEGSMQQHLHSFQRRGIEADFTASPSKKAKFADPEGAATWHQQNQAAAAGWAAHDVHSLSCFPHAEMREPSAHTLPHPSAGIKQGGLAYPGPDSRQGEAAVPSFSSQLQAGAGSQPQLSDGSYSNFNQGPSTNGYGPPAAPAYPQDLSFTPSGAPWAPNPSWWPSTQVQTYQGAAVGPGTGSMPAAAAPCYWNPAIATIQPPAPVPSSGIPFALRPPLSPPLPAPSPQPGSSCLPGNPAVPAALQQFGARIRQSPEVAGAAPAAADTSGCAAPTSSAAMRSRDGALGIKVAREAAILNVVRMVAGVEAGGLAVASGSGGGLGALQLQVDGYNPAAAAVASALPPLLPPLPLSEAVAAMAATLTPLLPPISLSEAIAAVAAALAPFFPPLPQREALATVAAALAPPLQVDGDKPAAAAEPVPTTSAAVRSDGGPTFCSSKAVMSALAVAVNGAAVAATAGGAAAAVLPSALLQPSTAYFTASAGTASVSANSVKSAANATAATATAAAMAAFTAAEEAYEQQLRDLCTNILPLGQQLTLLGMDKNSRPTREVFEVVMGKLLGIGGYGVAFLVELISHIRPAAAAQPAAAADAASKRPAKEQVVPKQLVLKGSLPEAAMKLKQQYQEKFEQIQQQQQGGEQQQQLEGDDDILEAYSAWEDKCSCSWRKEFDVMTKCLPYPGVLGCYGRGRVKIATGAEQEWLLLEYAEHGSLEQVLVGAEGQPQGLSPEQAREVLDDILFGLAIASRLAHAIHRDIKPENIMLCKPPASAAASLRHCPWRAKLGDWGICKQLVSPAYLGRTLDHTPIYIAPEQQGGQCHDVRLDSWQVGLLLLHIRLGLPPFSYLFLPEVGDAEREQRRSGEELDNPDSPYCSLLLPVEKEFVKACLQKNVAARPTPIDLKTTRYFNNMAAAFPRE